MLGNGQPHLYRFKGKGIEVAKLAAQLGGNSFVTNEHIVVSGYELIVVICNYQIYPITAESRTPKETFTTRVDPVSAPPSLKSILVLDQGLRPQARNIVVA